MKVAIVCGYPLTKMYTGSKIYEDKLTYYLSHIRDIELHIMTVGKKNRQFRKDNLIIHVIKTRRPFYIHFLTEILLMKSKIREIEPDIIHGISAGFPYSAVTAVLKDEYPTVLTTYGIAAKETQHYKKDITKIQEFIFGLFTIINERYIHSKIPNVIVESSSIKDLISKWTKSRVYIVPIGIEYGEIEKIQSNNLLILNERPDIFIVVNLEKVKGVDILIKAIPIVTNSIPHLKVWIAGCGPQEHELKVLSKKLKLDDHVKFLGFITDQEKYRNYNACKIVVVPSRWDCQPFALFDAAASGKPVVASDMSNPGIVDNGKTGFIFKSMDISDLASKIIVLLNDDKLRDEMGRAAKEKAKQYDWSKIAARTVEIYKDVIADYHET